MSQEAAPENSARRASVAESSGGIEQIEFSVSPSLSDGLVDPLNLSADYGRSTRPPALASQFIRGQRRSSFTGQLGWSVRLVLKFLRNPLFVNFMGLLTIFDAYLTCSDIDRRAAGLDVVVWMNLARDFCLFMYLIEYVLWMWVKRWGGCVDTFMLIDLFILVTGFADVVLDRILQWEEGMMENLGWLRFLRIMRIMRVLKLFRRISYLKELRKLMTMATTCMKTLLWSFLFCFVIMSCWAMLLVDIVYPLIQENEELVSCVQCQRAASSVMDANLLLFKTVIAGDSWGLIAVPLIEAHPATAIIFVGSLLTLEFGVLNLIVAVVVDTFAEIRERDVMNRAEEMEAEIEEDKRFLQRIFDRADGDGSGELTFEELLEGARNDPEFQSRLRVMDIDEADLQQLFKMIDVDGSGAVEKEEFIQPLSRWVHESKTATRFIKYNVARALHENEELRDYTNARFEQLNTNISRIAVCLGVPLAGESSKAHKRSSTKSLVSGSVGGGSKMDLNLKTTDPVSAVEASVTLAPMQAPLGLNKSKSILTRLVAMEEQQKTFFQNFLGSNSEEPGRQVSGQPAEQAQLSQTISTPTSSLSVPGFSSPQAMAPKKGHQGPPPSSDGDEAPTPNEEKKQGSPSQRVEDADEVDGVEARLDFSGFKDFYNRRKQSLQDSADVSAVSSVDLDEGRDAEFLQSRSSVREMDSVLRGTMEVVEDLLQSAASAAVTRAEYTLRLRLGALVSEMGPSGAARFDSKHAYRGTPKDDDAMSPALLTGAMGPEDRRRRASEMQAVTQVDLLPAPPPHRRLRSLDEPPERGKKSVHVDVVESYPVQI